MGSNFWGWAFALNIGMLIFNVACLVLGWWPVVAVVCTGMSACGLALALYGRSIDSQTPVVIVARRRWRDGLGDL